MHKLNQHNSLLFVIQSFRNQNYLKKNEIMLKKNRQLTRTLWIEFQNKFRGNKFSWICQKIFQICKNSFTRKLISQKLISGKINLHKVVLQKELRTFFLSIILRNLYDEVCMPKNELF